MAYRQWEPDAWVVVVNGFPGPPVPDSLITAATTQPSGFLRLEQAVHVAGNGEHGGYPRIVGKPESGVGWRRQRPRRTATG